MKLILLPQASGELADAVEYYEGEEAGLGERLWLEVDDHLRWIAANATLPRLRSGDYRRVNLKVFPERTAWLAQSERRLREVWDNEADDVFNELLTR